MSEYKRIGVDTSKDVFTLHGIDAQDCVTLQRDVKRAKFLAFFAKLAPTDVALEACGASHHWGRQLRSLGHRVQLIPPQYTKPFVKRGKSDRADAAAICEAAGRPGMASVPVKSAQRQAELMQVRVRELLVRQRTQLVNALRGHAAEFGLVAAKGIGRADMLLALIAQAPEASTPEASTPEDQATGDQATEAEAAEQNKTAERGPGGAEPARLPALAREALAMLGEEIRHLDGRIAEVDAKLLSLHKANPASRRLAEVPGIGPVTAISLALSVEPGQFSGGRHLAAWMGLTPKDHSSGGKQQMGSISRAGNERLRQLLVVGATAVIRHVKPGGRNATPWLLGLLARKPRKLAAVALANKMARIVWAMLARGEAYRRPVAAAG